MYFLRVHVDMYPLRRRFLAWRRIRSAPIPGGLLHGGFTVQFVDFMGISW